MTRNIAILGSTGSIGCQALEVVKSHPGRFTVELLTAQNNSNLLIRQALEFRPDTVVIGLERHYEEVREALSHLPIKVFAGQQAITQAVEMEGSDIVLNALVGYAGFRPTVHALRSGKAVALANKESLVVGGALISHIVAEEHVPLIPVDSEHSAIFQCMAGEDFDAVEKIFLTASGGPFLGKDLEELSNVTPVDALKHPNWQMGSKVTIDSASLMNKGLEVIEARWLFGMEPARIDVLIHPQSIIHSLVQFRDGSVKAQLGLHDMRLPILYALGYPERLSSPWPRLDLTTVSGLTFSRPDTNIFRNLALAYEALDRGGNACCVLNAANEEAVKAFLCGKSGFLDIPKVIEKCLDLIGHIPDPVLEDYDETDRETRKLATSLISGY